MGPMLGCLAKSKLTAHFSGAASVLRTSKWDRIDRRFGFDQTGKRRVVVALRQRKGGTLPFVSTNESHGVYIASRTVKPGSTVIADEAGHWDALQATSTLKGLITRSLTA